MGQLVAADLDRDEPDVGVHVAIEHAVADRVGCRGGGEGGHRREDRREPEAAERLDLSHRRSLRVPAPPRPRRAEEESTLVEPRPLDSWCRTHTSSARALHKPEVEVRKTPAPTTSLTSFEKPRARGAFL